jgi:hypothetical protein
VYAAQPAEVRFTAKVNDVATVELAVLARVTTEGAVTLMPGGSVPTPTMMVAVALRVAVDVTTTLTAVEPVFVSQVSVGVADETVNVDVLACAMPEQTAIASNAANARGAWVFNFCKSIFGTIVFLFVDFSTSSRRGGQVVRPLFVLSVACRRFFRKILCKRGLNPPRVLL